MLKQLLCLSLLWSLNNRYRHKYNVSSGILNTNGQEKMNKPEVANSWPLGCLSLEIDGELCFGFAAAAASVAAGVGGVAADWSLPLLFAGIAVVFAVAMHLNASERKKQNSHI